MINKNGKIRVYNPRKIWSDFNLNEIKQLKRSGKI